MSVTALLLLGLVTIVFGGLRLSEMHGALTTQVRPVEVFDSRYVDRPLSSTVHIVLGSLFMLLGPFQFVPWIRRRWPGVHRWSGRVFVLSALIIGLTSLHMALFLPAFGGVTTQAATLFFGVFFLVSLVLAVHHVRGKRIQLHREWMIRTFALGLAVSTIRVYIGLFLAFSDYTVVDVFGVSFWLAFCTHALVAELMIQRMRSAPRAARRMEQPRA